VCTDILNILMCKGARIGKNSEKGHLVIKSLHGGRQMDESDQSGQSQTCLKRASESKTSFQNCLQFLGRLTHFFRSVCLNRPVLLDSPNWACKLLSQSFSCSMFTWTWNEEKTVICFLKLLWLSVKNVSWVQSMWHESKATFIFSRCCWPTFS
jgi:hypothetical protein